MSEAETNQPRPITTTANGIRFGALEWGDPGAPLALLLHGYPDTAWTWRHLGPHLALKGWHVVAPFTRGYAPTALAPDDSYLVSDLAADALALADAFGADERSVLIGHDWGAATLWAIAQEHPRRFAALAALSVPPTRALLDMLSTPAEARYSLRQIRMSWYFLFNQLPGIAERGLHRVIPFLWRRWSPGFDSRADLAHVFAALPDHAHRRAALRYYRNNLQRGLVRTFSIVPQAPALYLHGADDGCMQADIAHRHRDRLAPGSTVQVVPACGHFLHLEQPETVNAIISDWIASPGSRDAPATD